MYIERLKLSLIRRNTGLHASFSSYPVAPLSSSDRTMCFDYARTITRVDGAYMCPPWPTPIFCVVCIEESSSILMSAELTY